MTTFAAMAHLTWRRLFRDDFIAYSRRALGRLTLVPSCERSSSLGPVQCSGIPFALWTSSQELCQMLRVTIVQCHSRKRPGSKRCSSVRYVCKPPLTISKCSIRTDTSRWAWPFSSFGVLSIIQYLPFEPKSFVPARKRAVPEPVVDERFWDAIRKNENFSSAVGQPESNHLATGLRDPSCYMALCTIWRVVITEPETDVLVLCSAQGKVEEWIMGIQIILISNCMWSSAQQSL